MNDYFDRLGFPRRFALDGTELERAYLARSRAVHPDYHLSGPDSELAASLELSAALNEAYNTLRDPFQRADYLLILEGGPPASQSRQMPSEFLAEMLEAREEIEQSQRKPDEVTRLEAAFNARYSGLMDEVAELFTQYESLPLTDAKRTNLLGSIRGLLNAAKYVRGLMRDLHAD